ncbi:hypothetical protein [Streptomyces asiaticus]|uniref:hypothetical protein n=1 Tax=Streptomyces asiaticus TaxID=114695 RepID=UPI003D72C10B
MDTAVSALRVTVLCESADAAAGIVRANAKTTPLATKTTLRICTSPPVFDRDGERLPPVKSRAHRIA